MKNTRQKSAGSLKNNIPISTVPTAPIPVHTAYAVPKGRVCVAFIRSAMEANKQRIKPPYHIYVVDPVASFALPRQVVKPISNRPPSIKNIQFIMYVIY